MSDSAALPAIVRAFLDAVDTRDAAATAACFTEAAVYHLAVPREPVRGRAAIEAEFARVLGETDRVRWEVVTVVGSGERWALERVDRFWYRGVEAFMECVGIVELEGELISAVRDYADLSTWRVRKAAALDAAAGTIES